MIFLNLIFRFIFDILNLIFKTLNFNLPGLDFTYLEFILSCSLVYVIFYFLVGSFKGADSWNFFTLKGTRSSLNQSHSSRESQLSGYKPRHAKHSSTYVPRHEKK